jgi:polyphosphate glucokinase
VQTLGIDIGGSGIKGAPVDTEKGEMTAQRLRIPTPNPATPEAVGDVVAKIAAHFGWDGPLGCTFPAVIKNGVAHTAANVDPSWIGTDVASLLHRKTGCPTLVLNDADAAGIAEMIYGAGRDEHGVVIMLTFGAGIGTAIFVNRQLLPNTELGHMEIRGKEAEHRASDAVRKKKDLTWAEWAKRVNEFIQRMDALFWPDLFIIGGGVSNKAQNFMPLLRTRARIEVAQLRNEAGIIGAALAARHLSTSAPDLATGIRL